MIQISLGDVPPPIYFPFRLDQIAEGSLLGQASPDLVARSNKPVATAHAPHPPGGGGKQMFTCTHSLARSRSRRRVYQVEMLFNVRMPKGLVKNNEEKNLHHHHHQVCRNCTMLLYSNVYA